MVGIGVLGSGDMGGAYAEAIAIHVPDARLVAIHGGRRAAALARDYGAAHEERLDGLLARRDVDGVVVATPHSAHLAGVLAATRAGKHVIVEKPMALGEADADAMIAAAAEARVLLDVILTMRYDSHVLAARKLILDGAIGSVRMLRLSGLTAGYDMGHKTWIGDPAEGGALLDWGSHGFDILRWLAGADPVRLTAELDRFDPATPVGDATAMVQLAYENGVRAQMWMSYELPAPGLDSAFRLWIVGSDGIIEVSRFGPCRLGRGDGWETVLEAGTPDWAIERRHDPLRMESPIAQLREFVARIGSGAIDAAASQDHARAGRWAVLQVGAARRSAATGATVELLPPPG